MTDYKTTKFQTTIMSVVKLSNCWSAKCPSGSKKKRKMVEQDGEN